MRYKERLLDPARIIHNSGYAIRDISCPSRHRAMNEHEKVRSATRSHQNFQTRGRLPFDEVQAEYNRFIQIHGWLPVHLCIHALKADRHTDPCANVGHTLAVL